MQTNEFSEQDFALIDALQENARATWAELGSRTAKSATTVRRRWERLSTSGTLWISSHWSGTSGVVSSSVSVRCAVGRVPAVVAALVRHPKIFNLAEVTGEYDLALVVVTADIMELRTIVQDEILSVPGVVVTQTRILTRRAFDGADWKFGALPRKGADGGEVDVLGRLSFRDPRVRAVLQVLETSPRATSRDFSAAMDISDAHARRFVREVLDQRIITQRVDFPMRMTTRGVGIEFHLDAPAGRLTESVGRIAVLPGVRLSSVVAGKDSNVFAVVWLQDYSEAVELEEWFGRQCGMTVRSRNVIVHYHKRAGYVFDLDQNPVEFVSWFAGDEAVMTDRA